MKRAGPWRKSLPTGIAAVIVFVATACGGGSTTNTASTVGCPTSGTINLSIWGGYPEVDPVFKQAGQAFQAQHSNVTLTVFSTDLRGFEQKLTTALPSKTAGDIILKDTSTMSRYIDQGLVAPVPQDLKNLVKGGGYNPGLVKDTMYNNQIAGVPFFNTGSALYYNKDMFAAAGIANPPNTMDELIADASKLAKYDAKGNLTRSGWSLRLKGQGSGVAEKFWILLLQYGHSLIEETSPGKYKVTFNGPEGVNLLNTYATILKDNIDSETIDADTKAFETGQTAMYAREPNVVADIAKNAPNLVGHYGTVSLPNADIGGGQYLYVPSASQNQGCAWEFVKFLTQKEQQISLVTTSGWLPARSDLDFSSFINANPGYAGFLKKPAKFSQVFYPTFPEFDEIETKLADHLVSAYADFNNLAGHKDRIQTLMNGWADETTSILRQSGHLA